MVELKIQPQLTGYTSDSNFTPLNYTLQQVLAYPLAVAKLESCNLLLATLKHEWPSDE